jgi:peptidoglycan hydrolase-like protein with peptidoglycan-binding domain
MRKRLLFSMSILVFLLITLATPLSVSLQRAQAAGSWPIYRRGSSGENVISIQYMLRSRGYQLNVDGRFGQLTAQAVIDFQGKNGLRADGAVGPLTWPKLIVTTRTGSSGEAVIALQRQLNAHSYNLVTDGRFGQLTAQAVMDFQGKNGLRPDAIAGPLTWNSLVGSSSDGGTYSVVGTPTIDANFINTVLTANNSPAQGTGQALYNYGVQYGIDPVYALAFFRHESSFGKYGRATENKALGNIRCSSGSSTYECNDSFRKYPTWEAGYEDWYQLIRGSYVNQRNLVTVDQIVPVYAPSTENDVAAYISSIKQAVDAWRVGRI